ncbi:MAG: MBL fold metallo-hydrolase [Verrucomicrobiales bacterium]|nr:MBL fold metallo-hydrolase [Verrucomicrobiales bacterium]
MPESITIETLDLHFQGLPNAIASFLVSGPNGKVLIETGPETCRETLLSRLADRGISPKDLDAVFVTHIHLDHAGSAGWFAAEGVPLYVHKKGARHLIEPSRLVESARMVYGDRFDSLWGEMTPAPRDQVFAIGDNAEVELGGMTIKAIETPGHAFHHHAYAVGDAIFAGDSSGARVDESGYLSLTSAPPQFHLEHTLASIDRLEQLGKDQLFLTHFGEVPDPKQHWADYREVVELNVEFVRQRLKEGMDDESLRIAYQAFQMEQAFRCQTARETWDTLQEINGTGMCADGIRMYWQRKWDQNRS